MNQNQTVHSGKADPHFDGQYEGVISSPKGIHQAGLQVNAKTDHPFHVTSLRKDPEMERFSRFVDGK